MKRLQSARYLPIKGYFMGQIVALVTDQSGYGAVGHLIWIAVIWHSVLKLTVLECKTSLHLRVWPCFAGWRGGGTVSPGPCTTSGIQCGVYVQYLGQLTHVIDPVCAISAQTGSLSIVIAVYACAI